MLNPLKNLFSSGKPGLARIFFVYSMTVATVTSISLTLYFTITQFNKYKAGNELLKIEFPKSQRQEIQFRITQAKDYIQFVRTHPSINITKYVHSKITIAEKILRKGIHPSNTRNYKISREAILNLEKLNEKSAVQIIILQGNQPVYFDKTALFYDKKADNRKLSMESFASVRKYELPKGWSSVHRVPSGEPVSFFRKIAKSDLTIFALVLPDDSIKILQEMVLDSLSKIRYDSGEYIFINSYDGKGLITKGNLNKEPLDILQGSDSNWKAIFRKELELSQIPSGSFFTYKWSKDQKSGYTVKESYIAGIEDWKWIIGSGVHKIDIEPILKQREDELWSGMKSDFFRFILFMLVLYITIYLVTRLISKLTSSNILLFVNFFRNAAQRFQPIEETKLHFREFQTLAIAANKMISERERIKTVLANEQSRLNYIMDAIPDMVFFKDTAGHFIGGNKAFEKYTGKSISDIQGKSEYELFPKQNADSYIASDKKLLITLQPLRNHEWITYPDGQKILCDTLKTLYFDREGNVLGIIGISRDITEMEETRQRLIMAKEKAEESDRLKTAFLANMSHEIRTPMNAIIGFSDLLSEETLTKEEKEDFISKIKVSGESLMNIINDIIDIAKIEAGQLTILNADCNLDQILMNLFGTISEMKNRLKKNKLEIKLSLPQKQSPVIAHTDPLRLQQVLNNLLSNALKFCESGTVEFGYIPGDKEIKFFVRDTGIGIMQSKHEMLFQRFSQVDPSSTRKYGGTGLGLAISKNIVELMGGTIWLDSEPGQGSVFYFTIPRRTLHTHNNSEHWGDGMYNWTGKTVLVAEDSEENYLLVEAIIRFTGVNLIRAVNGQQAIDLANSDKPVDLILMDIQLPVKTGYEAIHEILLQKPSMPIITFTAYALPGEREKSLKAGCVDYMVKPIKSETLLKSINPHLI